MDDFERATERVLGGLEKHNSLMSKEASRRLVCNTILIIICYVLVV